MIRRSPLYVFYLQAGLVEVLPQKWFGAASQYQIGKQWIPRAARDPESHRIFGECFGVGSFLLEDDGCRLDQWMKKALSTWHLALLNLSANCRGWSAKCQVLPREFFSRAA